MIFEHLGFALLVLYAAAVQFIQENWFIGVTTCRVWVENKEKEKASASKWHHVKQRKSNWKLRQSVASQSDNDLSVKFSHESQI